MNIIDDKRKIKKILVVDEGHLYAGDIVEITPYEENGEMAKIIWFEIVVGGKIIKRVNGKYVIAIDYK